MHKRSGQSIVYAVFIFCVFIFFYEPSTIIKNAEDFALGNQTASLYADIDGLKIHCNDYMNASECFKSYEISRIENSIVWLGNSQLHGVNQLKPSQTTSTEIMHRALYKDDYFLMTFSQANGNFKEQYILFEYLRSKAQIKYLILAIVMDDMREATIRPSIENALSEENVNNNLSLTDFGTKILEDDLDSENNDQPTALEDTLQETTETYLDESLSAISDYWNDRENIRNKIYFNLYAFRNYIFGINASTERKMISHIYQENLEAFSTIIEVAKKEEITVLPYISPIRNDFNIPYNYEEYESFKKRIHQITDQNGFRLLNLENAIPNNFWGMKESTVLGQNETEIDFMHFKAEGHEILASLIYNEILLLEEQSR